MKIREVTHGLVRHPLSAAWGNMSDGGDNDDLKELRDDIIQNGQRHPVVVINGNEVIDGWQRARACQYGETIPIRVRDYPLEEKGIEGAFKFVMSEHMRRSWTAQQRADAILACHAWLESGDNQYTPRGGDKLSPPRVSNSKMAEEAGVSVRTIQRAKQKLRDPAGSTPKPDDRLKTPQTNDIQPTPDVEINRLRVENERLKSDLESAMTMLHSDDREIFDRLRAEIQALKSQNHELLSKASDLSREVYALRKGDDPAS